MKTSVMLVIILAAAAVLVIIINAFVMMNNVERRKFKKFHADLDEFNVSVPNSSISLPPLIFRGHRKLPAGSERQLPGLAACYRNDEYKFQFLHLPKNGGSALVHNLRTVVCEALGRKKDDCDGVLKSVSLKKCNVVSGYFSFTFARNPYDRAVSMWSYGLKRQILGKSKEAAEKITQWYCSFESFLKRRRFGANMSGCGFHSESSQWPVIVKNGKGQLDFVGRMERFERDWTTILNTIDSSGKLLEIYKRLGFAMHNDSGHKPYTEYYNKALKDLVKFIWRQDVDNLGYGFETKAAEFEGLNDYHPARDVLGSKSLAKKK